MNLASLRQFSADTVFSSPLILQFGISKVVWSSAVAATIDRPAVPYCVNRNYPTAGQFGSNAELYAYQSWQTGPFANRVELLTNVPLSSIFAIDSQAVTSVCGAIGYTSQADIALAQQNAALLIGSKSVDLLLIEKASNRLLLGLEVDSDYHVPPWKVDHDMMKSSFFLAHNKRLLRLYNTAITAAMPWRQFNRLLNQADANWNSFRSVPGPGTLQLHMPGGHQSKPWYEWVGE